MTSKNKNTPTTDLKLVFATNNKDKITEIQHIIGNKMLLLSLRDIACYEEIPETSPTIAGNALQKARYVKENYGYDCFADDTGLEIDALDGRPGVFSARYAGENVSYQDNVDKVLREMQDKTNRAARFKTVIALIIDSKEYTFEGTVEGNILDEERGKNGFGYDPVFMPRGFRQTFAEMPPADKHEISHRGIAVRQLIKFLNELAHA